MYTTWLFNHGERKRARSDKFKWGKKWTARSVVSHQRREEIVELTGGRAGDKEMIGNYQAEEWTNNTPPPDVQAKFTQRKGDAVTKSFASYMWKQGGCRVFVMSAWKKEDGEVRIHG
jgi:hypothetical protein